MFATSSVVANRLISVDGRVVFRKFCSASSWVMPCSFADAFIQLSMISERVGPGRTALTVTPVPLPSSANPLDTASWAVFVTP